MSRLYTSRFVDIRGNVWRADIVNYAEYGTNVSDFDFDIQPAEIDWPDRELHEPLIGSSCTLRVVSPADRTFIGLYAAEPGDVTLRLYRNNILFWCGSLDPEFYEEPYDTGNNYEVSLSFSDLGALDRLAFDLDPDGVSDIASLIARALSAASMGAADIIEAHGLSRGGAPFSLSQLTVRNANFYDEDGVGASWREVLAGVLQPLALRIAQIDGCFKIFDLYTQRSAYWPRQIAWEGTGHMLGCGKVYNDIEVKFSPYGDTKAIDTAVESDTLSMSGISGMITFLRDSNPNSYQGFFFDYRMSCSEPLPEIVDTTRGAFYRMRKIYSGEDGAGIVGKVCACIGAQTTVFGGVPWAFHTNSLGTFDNITTLFRAGSAYLDVNAGYSDDMICVKATVMLDARVNPFEPASAANEEGDYKRQEKGWNIVYIPARIYIVADDGSIYYYDNNDARKSSLLMAGGLEAPGSGKWNRGAAPHGSCWLAYYDWNIAQDNSPCNGWMTNHQCRGRYSFPLEWWQKRGDGEFIPMPPVSGVLHVEIGSGIGMYSYQSKTNDEIGGNITSYEVPRWLLYKSVSVDIVDGFGRAKETEDTVYTAAISATARGRLTIDTICGSSENTLATARGIISLDGVPLGNITRGSLTGTPERLLIAAIASQYDTRHTTLSGEVSTASIDLTAIYTDAAQPSDRRFAITSCRYNVREACADTTFTELSEQKYIPA